MKAVYCPYCGGRTKRNGRTSSGSQRWRCMACGASTTLRYDDTAARLEEFLGWLLSKDSQATMPGGGRSFRRRTAEFWEVWPELHPISWTLKLRFEKREASEMPRRKKARYGREMRARAADLFEAGLGFELAAKRLDVPAPAVRKWLCAYRATGRKGLIGMGESRRTYDMETKLAVARAVVDEGMPRSEAMARFGIAAATSLDRWCRLYRDGGPEALEPGRRGRPEGPGGRTRERELEERVRKLEAQVAYLKKSIALKAEKSSQTGRKPRS